MGIRNAAKALIIRDEQILLNKCRHTLGEGLWGLTTGEEYYDLPGGGQELYETIEEAVVRECLEETGHVVTVERLAAVYEEITMDTDFRTGRFAAYAHKIHFAFVCTIAEENAAAERVIDFDVEDAVWIDLADIDKIKILPKLINDNLRRVLQSDVTLFLGSERV